MYQRILVPLDGSEPAERGLKEALSMAAGQKTRLHLLHVVNAFPVYGEMAAVGSYDDLRDSMRRAGEELLAKALQAAGAAGVEAEAVLRETTQGRVAATIVEEAQNAGCDLIVMGTHGRRGFSHLVMGSDAELVVRTSPVPVLLVREVLP